MSILAVVRLGLVKTEAHAQQSAARATSYSVVLFPASPLEAAETQLLAALRAWRPSARALDDDCVRYRYVDEACVRHTMSVASGLASRVKGDAQIAQQFRQAAETSSQAARCGPVLNSNVQAALRTARRVHRETGIGCGSIHGRGRTRGHPEPLWRLSAPPYPPARGGPSGR